MSMRWRRINVNVFMHFRSWYKNYKAITMTTARSDTGTCPRSSLPDGVTNDAVNFHQCCFSFSLRLKKHFIRHCSTAISISHCLILNSCFLVAHRSENSQWIFESDKTVGNIRTSFADSRRKLLYLLDLMRKFREESLPFCGVCIEGIKASALIRWMWYCDMTNESTSTCR